MDLRKTKEILKITVYVSLVIQALTGIFNIGLASLDTYDKSFDDDVDILIQLIWLGLIVQIIEGTFYIWLAKYIYSVSNITMYRYYDWFFSTPTMLITFVVYLLYLKEKEKEKIENEKIDTTTINKKVKNIRNTGKKSNNSLWDYVKNNKTTLSIILLLNALMLIFGYLGEIGILSTNTAVLSGFVPFILYFYMIYEYYAKFTNYGVTLFWFFAVVWSLYGFAALTPYYTKNISYNILDIFSKNFFEIFIGIKLLMAYNYM